MLTLGIGITLVDHNFSNYKWSSFLRRAHLKECFETLKKNIPNVDEKKTSNLSVLRSALRYIQVSSTLSLVIDLQCLLHVYISSHVILTWLEVYIYTMLEQKRIPPDEAFLSLLVAVVLSEDWKWDISSASLIDLKREITWIASLLLCEQSTFP